MLGFADHLDWIRVALKMFLRVDEFNVQEFFGTAELRNSTFITIGLLSLLDYKTWKIMNDSLQIISRFR